MRLHDRNWPTSWFQLARAASIVADANDGGDVARTTSHRPTERCIQVSLATVCLGAADLATAWLLHTIGEVDGPTCTTGWRRTSTLVSVHAPGWHRLASDHARLLIEP